MRRIEYHKNQKINNLIFIQEVLPAITPSGRKTRMARFECVCGNKFVARIEAIKGGHTKSCGCLSIKKSKENFKTHGLSKHKLYSVWGSMKQRCYDKNYPSYHRYGGRNIKMCFEWENNAEAFIRWAISNGYQKTLEIDRIDNNGDYSPTNCRWTTRLINVRNSTISKLNIKQVKEIREAKQTMGLSNVDLASQYKVTPEAISAIIHNKTWKGI